jgi:hypothetical protein
MCVGIAQTPLMAGCVLRGSEGQRGEHPHGRSSEDWQPMARFSARGRSARVRYDDREVARYRRLPTTVANEPLAEKCPVMSRYDSRKCLVMPRYSVSNRDIAERSKRRISSHFGLDKGHCLSDRS